VSEIPKATTGIYESVAQAVFSGRFAPGDRLVEQGLADELGVSRIPVREALGKMVAQGVLVGGKKHQGVWMREYSPEEIRQLYEFRGLLEAGVAGAAAEMATKSDIMHLEIICEQMEAEAVDIYGTDRWGELDHRFHETLAEAGRNERYARALKSLLAECHYVLFYPSRRSLAGLTDDQIAKRVQSTIDEHRELLDLVRQGKVEEAEKCARMAMRQCSERISREMITGKLNT
jgi:DNA-binding GntR family transcriptional regulator